MIGIKFLLKDAVMQDRLENLVDRLTTGKENLVKVDQVYCRENEG